MAWYGMVALMRNQGHPKASNPPPRWRAWYSNNNHCYHESKLCCGKRKEGCCCGSPNPNMPRPLPYFVHYSSFFLRQSRGRGVPSIFSVALLAALGCCVKGSTYMENDAKLQLERVGGGKPTQPLFRSYHSLILKPGMAPDKLVDLLPITGA